MWMIATLAPRTAAAAAAAAATASTAVTAGTTTTTTTADTATSSTAAVSPTASAAITTATAAAAADADADATTAAAAARDGARPRAIPPVARGRAALTLGAFPSAAVRSRLALTLPLVVECDLRRSALPSPIIVP